MAALSLFVSLLALSSLGFVSSRSSFCPKKMISFSMGFDLNALSLWFPAARLYSVLSKYGVHSFPSLLLVNGTSRIRYRGLKPIPYYDKDELLSIESVGKPMIQLPKTSSRNNIWKNEPFLIFSFVFICFRIAVIKLPHVLYHLNNLWRSYIPHLNLEIFGETRQLVGHILHMVDIRRVWAKLRLSQTNNFHKGARNARVWASSLASVSLGESLFSRST